MSNSTPTASIKTQEGSSNEKRRVILNVGGSKHELLWSTLNRFPHTRLGKLQNFISSTSVPYELCDDFSPFTQEFYFDRQPNVFNSILNVYRTGKLHLEDGICPIAFDEEMKYWGLDETFFDACCLHKYINLKDVIQDEIRKEAESLEAAEKDEFGFKKFDRCRKFFWDLFEKPSSSIAARVVSILSMFFILLATIGLILNTIPQFRDCNYTGLNESISAEHSSESWSTQEENSESICGVSKYLNVIEILCISWFTMEYILRFIACPNKCKFLKGVMNMIDLLAILPYFIVLIIEAITKKDTAGMHRILQSFRIIRILKLARHSKGLQSLGCTVRNSYKELGLLAMFLSMGILMFSSLAFFAEYQQNEQFSSIPSTFWWAIITMTTVGYGDMYPTTLPGKIIGGVCAVSGVLVIALPIPIIVNNFMEYLKDQKAREKTLERRRAVIKAKRGDSPPC